MTNNNFNTYKECIPYLFNLERAGIKYDLKNIRALLKFSDNPQRNFKSIHIAGTNGKGSVSSILNSFLIEKGFKTGLYTSPHIKDFRERILVNGKVISKKFILEFVNRNFSIIEKIKPSFFEVTTAMAFEYFSHRNVNYAVIETGLGGRLDSTNIIKPVLSVITSLSIDHTDYLGKKIDNITFEKGGIIKKNIPSVIGIVPDISKKILKRIAKENKSEIIFTRDKPKIKITKRIPTGFYFDISKFNCNFFFPVVGDYQTKNINTFLSAIDILSKEHKINYSAEEIADTFRNIRSNSNLYGRFDLISSSPGIVVDVSHNLQAIENIKKNLKYFKYNKLVIIFGMMQDKHYSECVNKIGKLDSQIILTKPEYKRAALPDELYKSVVKNKFKFTVKDDLADAFKYSLGIAGKKGLILVTGSFFLVSDFLKIFKKS